jgi:uncharacterized membrane protein
VIERSDIEEVDAFPVQVQVPVPAPESGSPMLVPRSSVVPVVQTAAVAAGGFVAGAVVVGVLGRRHQRAIATRPRRRLGRSKRVASELVEIVGSRSLLVDVHLLGSPARSR